MQDQPPQSPSRAARYLSVLVGLLVVGFAASWAFSAGARNTYMDRDYGQWTAKMSMIRDCKVGDLAIIGDSRASAALVPRMLGPGNVRNLALTGTTPVEGYYEVKHILACPNPPTTIMMSFASEQFQEIDWFWLHAARYGFFSFSELEDVRRTESGVGIPYLYNGAFGTEPPGVVKNWLYVWSFPPFNFASMLAAHGLSRGAANDRVRQETFATAGQHLEGTAACAVSLGWEANREKFVAIPLVEIYLDKMIALIESRGIRLEIVLPPVSEMTANAMSSTYRAGFEAFITQLLHDHPTVRLIGPVFPVMNNCDFGDQHHVNQAGAEAFTRSVARELQTAEKGADWGAPALTQARSR